MIGRAAAALAAALLAWLVAGGAMAANCGTTAAGFPAWLAAYQREAVAAGIPPAVAASALGGLGYDAGVIGLDRRQGYFKQSFERYRATRATPAKIAAAKARLRQNAGLFQRIEERYGVPGPILVAIWGLETDFGAGTGATPVLRSLATLAYDCRRAAFFTNELTNALRIVARGDLTPANMRGGWAGELGQTQFLPSSYVKFAVDFDGDGRRDLIRSSADALASTANYLKGYGWRAGQPFGEGTANFQVLRQWNKAEVYCRTIAWLAGEIAR
jgi:lytic murein transglycosylase